MNNNKIEKQEFTIDDVLCSLCNIDSDIVRQLVSGIKITDLVFLVNDKKKADVYITECETCIDKVQNTIKGVRLLVDDLISQKKETSNILIKFEMLNEDEKKVVSIDLYNNKDFQNNLCYIILDGVKQSFPELLSISKAFGFDMEKQMREVILSGKGYKPYVSYENNI